MAFLIQPSFGGGELAPSLCGRVDLKKYGSGLKCLENFIVHPHGGVSKRDGTRYITDAAAYCRLVPFQYNLEAAYVLEFSQYAIRFFRNGAPVLNTDGTPYEVDTPYSQSDIDELTFTQSADILYIVHEKYKPRMLMRYGDKLWKLSLYENKFGPFMEQTEEQSKITMTPSAKSGLTNITASSAVFNSSHIGTHICLTQHLGEEIMTEKADASGDSYVEYDHENARALDGKVCGYCTTITTSEVLDHASCGDEYYVTKYTPEYDVRYAVSITDFQATDVGRVLYFGDDSANGAYRIAGYEYVSSVHADNSSNEAKLHSYKNASIGDVALILTHITGKTMSMDTVISDARVCDAVVAGNWGANVSGTCYKGWAIDTIGFWKGTFTLEYYDKYENRWIVLKTFTSDGEGADGDSDGATAKSKNYSVTGSFEEPTKLRIRSDDFEGYVPKDNEDEDKGEVKLTFQECDYTGTAVITGINSSTVATIQVESGREFATLYGTTNWKFGAWGEHAGYPRSVGFYQDRIVFGSTTKEPQTIWMSKTGSYYDFGTSEDVQDDDAVTVTLTSRRVSAIRYFMPLQALLALTSGSEWKITSGDGAGAPITPTSVNAAVQGYRGIASIEPAVVGNTLLYVQSQCMRVRDLAYTYENDSYTGNDVTVMANHLFESSDIVDMAYQQEPDSILWVVRADGVLCSLTYLKEHDVMAWARHPMTGGAKVESVAVISDEDGDDVYLSVLYNGQRRIEIMQPVKCTDSVTAFYLDCAETLTDDKGLTVIDGLERFEGKYVTVLADGAVKTKQKVSSGKITLKTAAKCVTVGLPYTSTLETMDLDLQRQDGAQLTRTMRVAKVGIRVQDTRGLWAGTDEDHLIEQIDRTNEAYNDPTKLATTDYHLVMDSRYDSGHVVLSAPSPLPCSVLAIVPEVAIGG